MELGARRPWTNLHALVEDSWHHDYLTPPRGVVLLRSGFVRRPGMHGHSARHITIRRSSHIHVQWSGRPQDLASEAQFQPILGVLRHAASNRHQPAGAKLEMHDEITRDRFRESESVRRHDPSVVVHESLRTHLIEFASHGVLARKPHILDNATQTRRAHDQHVVSVEEHVALDATPGCRSMIGRAKLDRTVHWNEHANAIAPCSIAVRPLP